MVRGSNVLETFNPPSGVMKGETGEPAWSAEHQCHLRSLTPSYSGFLQVMTPLLGALLKKLL